MAQVMRWFALIFALISVVSAFPQESPPEEYQREHPDEYTDDHHRHSYRPYREQPERKGDDDEGYGRQGNYETVPPYKHPTHHRHHRRHRHPQPQPQPDLAEERVEPTEVPDPTESAEQHAAESDNIASIAQAQSASDPFDDSSSEPIQPRQMSLAEWLMILFMRGKMILHKIWEGGKAFGNAAVAVGTAAVNGGKAVGNAAVAVGNAAVNGGKAVGNAAMVVGNAAVTGGKSVGNAAVTVYGWVKSGANGVVKAYNFVNDFYSLPKRTKPEDMISTTSSSDISDALNSGVGGLVLSIVDSTLSPVSPVTQETIAEHQESQFIFPNSYSRTPEPKAFEEQSQLTKIIQRNLSTHPTFGNRAHEDPPRHHPYYETKSREEEHEDTTGHPISSIRDTDRKPRSYDIKDPPRHHPYHETLEEHPEYTTQTSLLKHEYYQKPPISEDLERQDNVPQPATDDGPIINPDYPLRGDKRAVHYRHQIHRNPDNEILKQQPNDPSPEHLDQPIHRYRPKPVEDSSEDTSFRKHHRNPDDIDPNQDPPPIQHHHSNTGDDSVQEHYPESGEVPDRIRYATTEPYNPSIYHAYPGPHGLYHASSSSSEEDDRQPIPRRHHKTREPYAPSIDHPYAGPRTPYVYSYSRPETYITATQNYDPNPNDPFVYHYHPQPEDNSDSSEVAADEFNPPESSTQVFKKNIIGTGNMFVVCILFYCVGI